MCPLGCLRYRFAALNSVVCGICGSVAFAAPALMSATWFPVKERTIATSIGTFFVFMGVGMSFILGTIKNDLEIFSFLYEY